MTKEEMMEASKKKMDRVKALMDELKLSIEPRSVVGKNGFIEDIIIWIDAETYPPERMPESPEHV